MPGVPRPVAAVVPGPGAGTEKRQRWSDATRHRGPGARPPGAGRPARVGWVGPERCRRTRGPALSPNPVGDRFERLAQSIAERVVNLVLDAIDINALIERVDINAVVERVDVDKVVKRVDIDQIVARVDVDAIFDRVDFNAVVQKVDIDAVVSQMDIDSLVEKTELGGIIAKSTTGVLTEVLDVVRSQGVGLDDFMDRWTNRVLRRKPGSLPIGPPLLVAPPAPPALSPGGRGLEPRP